MVLLLPLDEKRGKLRLEELECGCLQLLPAMLPAEPAEPLVSLEATPLLPPTLALRLLPVDFPLARPAAFGGFLSLGMT